MEKIPRLTAQQRADLVAYLDGELDEATAKEIEATLAKSPVARHDVDMLVRTWELLDDLPRPALTAEFTEKTLATVRLAEVRKPWLPVRWPALFRSERARRGAILAGWAAGLALAAVGGFFAANRAIPSESRMLVDELPVIENLDVYANAGSIEFLRELQARVGTFDNPQEPPP